MDVIYKPGRHLFIADALSRNYSSEKQQKELVTEEELEVASIGQLDDIPATRPYLEDVRRGTAEDKDLKQLMNMIQQGLPEKKHDVPSELR